MDEKNGKVRVLVKFYQMKGKRKKTVEKCGWWSNIWRNTQQTLRKEEQTWKVLVNKWLTKNDKNE